MKRVSSILLSAVLAIGLAGTTSATAQGAPHHRGAHQKAHPKAHPKAAHRVQPAYTPPAIQWHACTDPDLKAYGAQCGHIIVPLDYSHPRGKKITVAVSRALHRSKHYQGVMLVNPGGPGGSGLGLSTLQQYVPNNVGFDYDWIGFDPRGVGASRPQLTCDPNFFHGDRPPYDVTTHSSLKTWVRLSKQYAAACVHAKGSALFGHVKTRDTVRDMESLRRALGAKTINFYGFSYGTYLAQVYMTLHPARVRRFVLDGTVDPRRVWYRANQDQDRAFQKTFNIYFTWLAKYHSVYHVGDTFAQVRDRWIATRNKLDLHASKGILGGDEFIDVFTSAGYYVFGWEDIAQAYSAYLNHNDPSGLIAMYKGANDVSPGGDNGYALYLGTQCTDAHWPRSQDRLNRENTALNKTYNYFTWSNAWFNGPCAYWHYRATTPVRVTGKNIKGKILMINETYDAATPYTGSLYVRKLFPTASLVEGKNGSTHAGSLFGVSCTDDTIARYLATGVVPPRQPGNHSDKVCPPNPQPNPTAPSAARLNRTAGGDAGSQARLRAILTGAQLHR